MGIKKVKPTTPGRRFYTVSTFEEITKKKPHSSLIQILKKKGGRNNLGRVTSRHRGGGEKRYYRIIDFKRDKFGIPAKVKSIEYDPNRSARIALLSYKDGEYRYIIAPEGLTVGNTVVSGPGSPIQIGNTLPLREIPVGVEIHNIQLQPHERARLVRSAGSSAQILAKEGNFAYVKLPSSEIRMIHLDCYATIGKVSNSDHEKIIVGKAGRKRHMGRKPRVRAMAMNPVDHPMGGGEGRSKSGKHPKSPTGILAKGKKTRKKNKPSDKFIIQRRK